MPRKSKSGRRGKGAAMASKVVCPVCKHSASKHSPDKFGCEHKIVSGKKFKWCPCALTRLAVESANKCAAKVKAKEVSNGT